MVLITAGFQVPVMLLSDLAGNIGGALFWHSGPILAKIGVTVALTVIFIVAVVAHGSAEVNVYGIVPVLVVLITAGLQVPVKLLRDVAGSTGGMLFRQSKPIGANVGVI